MSIDSPRPPAAPSGRTDPARPFIARISSLLQRVPFHVAFFSVYPILALAATNITQIAIADIYRSVIVTLICATLLLLLFRAALGSWVRASALVSLSVLLFFSYGHVYSLLKPVSAAGFLLGRHRVLLPVYTLLFSAAAAAILRFQRLRQGYTLFLNTMSIASLILPIYTIGANVNIPFAIAAIPQTGTDSSPSQLPKINSTELPDIYYIITDEYARADVLEEDYNYDNSAFVDFLRAHGFYVAEESTSNYYFTHLSLASSLNMDYIQNLDPDWRPGDRVDTTTLIHQSRVRRELENLGYTTIGFVTGWDASELFDAPIVLTPNKTIMETLQDRATFNGFEGFLIHSSAFLILLDLDVLQHTPASQFIAQRLQIRYRIQREIILAEFDNLETLPLIPGPKFAFVHIISPHGPYLFGPNGEETANQGPFTLGEEFVPAGGEGALRYRDQLIYITKRLEETITAIQSRSSRPVVIILQSDHGSKREVDWDNPTDHALSVARSIVNAYYVPEGCRQGLYPSISPVNTFRVIFNCLFGTSYDLLDDATYLGSYRFVEIDPGQ